MPVRDGVRCRTCSAIRRSKEKDQCETKLQMNAERYPFSCGFNRSTHDGVQKVKFWLALKGCVRARNRKPAARTDHAHRGSRATRTICRRIMSPSMATVSLSPK
jgi:hypothetical protein